MKEIEHHAALGRGRSSGVAPAILPPLAAAIYPLLLDRFHASIAGAAQITLLAGCWLAAGFAVPAIGLACAFVQAA